VLDMDKDINEVEASLDAGMQRFKDRATSWFFQQVDAFFPMKTGALRTSYKDVWDRFISSETMVIGSDLDYAGPVDKKTGVNWSTSGVIDNAATETGVSLDRLIETMLEASFK